MTILQRKDIKTLPDNSVIRKHNLDKWGYPQTLDITIKHEGRKTKYYYRDYKRCYVETYLQSFPEDDPYRYYELIKRGDEDDE